jgi:predicted phosphodiesterase
MDPIAVISDIHGNIWALEAVLKDIERRGITRIFNLGDCAHGPLEPRITTQRLMELDAVTVRGNHENDLIDLPKTISPSMEYTLNDLDGATTAWLTSQPLTVSPGDIFILFHSTPSADPMYLLEDFSSGYACLKTESVIQNQLTGFNYPVYCCGHSHYPRLVKLSNGHIVVNPGSVGLPAYTETEPVPHRVETGSPFARYAVIQYSSTGAVVEEVSVTYDWEKAARTAETHSRPDWAHWLLTGRV